MQTGILNWSNEASLTPYPLIKSFGLDDLLLDANFIQFDNFIPIFKKITSDVLGVTITIQFDLSLEEIFIPVADVLETGTIKKVYSNNRYLGRLVFGKSLSLFTTDIKKTITTNIPFLSHLVKSIPSRSGVYSIDSLYGDLVFLSDNNIYYEVAGAVITFNAAHVDTLSNTPYLKTINSVGPTANSVFIIDSDIIKVSVTGLSTIRVSLVGTTPSVFSNPESIIAAPPT